MKGQPTMRRPSSFKKNVVIRVNPLLLGVNIGGVGSLFASLASLITFREYTSHNHGKTGYYMRTFTLLNLLVRVALRRKMW